MKCNIRTMDHQILIQDVVLEGIPDIGHHVQVMTDRCGYDVFLVIKVLHNISESPAGHCGNIDIYVMSDTDKQ